MSCRCCKREACVELVPIFQNLSHEEMVEVAAITMEKTFHKGEMIYRAGDILDQLYIIHEGTVKISRLSPEGKEQVIRVVGCGDFIGELSLFSNLPNADYAQTLVDARMCTIQGSKLRELMIKYPPIALSIIRELSERLEKAEKAIENINLHPVEQRLAQLLINMTDDKQQVLLPMTRGDLASQIGVSQETLSRKLSAFQAMGLIKQIDRRRITILNLSELEQQAQGQL